MAQEEWRTHAEELESDAHNFRISTLRLWQAGLDTRDEGLLDAGTNLIYAEWAALEEDEDELNREVALAPRVTVELPAESVAVRRAHAAKDLAEEWIGIDVTLQRLQGTAVRGRLQHYPTDDVYLYLVHELLRAKEVLQIADRMTSIFDNPGLEMGGVTGLSAEQHKRLNGYVGSMRTRMEEQFLHAVLMLNGVHGAYQEFEQGSKAAREHSKDLMENSAVTHDGREAVDPELLEQMRHDADLIEGEVKARLTANKLLMITVLNRYPKTEDLDVFLKMLDGRLLIDGMLSRGPKAVREALDRSTHFKGHTYRASNDLGLSFSLAANAGDIVVEMGKQTPGAVAMMASGVFAGLSEVPVVGKVFAPAAQGFADVAKVADDATGATDIGREWRNTVAKATGYTISAMMQGGAGAEGKAAQVVYAAGAGAKGFDAASDLLALHEQIEAVESLVKQGSLMAKSGGTLIAELPGMIGDIRTGRGEDAVSKINTVCDDVAKAFGAGIKGDITTKGKKATAAKQAKSDGMARHNAALGHLATTTARLEGVHPDDISGEDLIDLRAAGAEVRQAAVARFAPQPGPVLQAAPGAAKVVGDAMLDALKEQLVDLLVMAVNAVRELLTDAVVDAMTDTDDDDPTAKLEDRPGWHDAFAKRVRKGAKTLGPKLAKKAMTAVTKLVTNVLAGLVMKLVKAKFPGFDAAAGPVKSAISEVVTYAIKELDAAAYIERPVTHGLTAIADSALSYVGLPDE